MTTFIALLRKDPDSDYGVDFSDFPGCITAGSTLEEAREMAAEALEFHIEGLLQEDVSIPEPSRLEVVMADPENAEAVPFPVAVPDQLTGVGQVDLTLPAADLDKIDALARKKGQSRSALLSEAVHRMVREAEEGQAA